MTAREMAQRISATVGPGQELRVTQRELQRIGESSLLGPLIGEGNTADRVLENIIGSSYEYGYREDLLTRDVVFYRLNRPLEDGRRTYVSPDRREYFERGPDGTYTRNAVPR